MTPAPLTLTDLADVDQLLSVRPRHQTSRMSWPVDEDTTRRLKRVIEGDVDLRWWTKLIRLFNRVVVR